MNRRLLARCWAHFAFGFTTPVSATIWLAQVWLIDPWMRRA